MAEVTRHFGYEIMQSVFVDATKMKHRTSVPGLEFIIPTRSHRDLVASLVKSPECMSSVGTGEPWSDEKLDDNLQRWEHEWTKEAGTRTEMCWLVVVNRFVVGIARLKKHFADGEDKDKSFNDDWFLTCFLSALWRGKGIGACAMELACEAFRVPRR